jgi:hypothetical protein
VGLAEFPPRHHRVRDWDFDGALCRGLLPLIRG